MFTQVIGKWCGVKILSIKTVPCNGLLRVVSTMLDNELIPGKKSKVTNRADTSGHQKVSLQVFFHKSVNDNDIVYNDDSRQGV